MRVFLMIFFFIPMIGGAREDLVKLLESMKVPQPESFSQLLTQDFGSTVGGIFSSHHDRRRSNDLNLPCESVNPLDTNDDDCATSRWNKLVWYLPKHDSLKKLYNRVVQTESQTEAFSSRVLSGIQASENALFGAGGTAAKPSGTSGLTSDLFILRSAAQQLQQAIIAQVDFMYNSLDKVSQTSISDTRNLKDALASAFSGLVESVKNASSRQTESASNNTFLGNAASRKALQEAADSILGKQEFMGSVLSSTINGAQTVENSSSSTWSQLEGNLQVAADSVAALGDGLSSKAELLKSDLSAAISKVSSSLNASSSSAAGNMVSQSSLLVSDVSSEAKLQMMSSKTDWGNMSETVLNRTNELASSLNRKVDSDLRTNVSGGISDASDSLSGKIEAGITQINNATGDNQRVVKDSSVAVSKFGDEVASDVTSVSSETVHANTDNLHVTSSAQKEAQDAIAQANGMSQESLNSAISAISDAQTDAREKLKSGSNGYAAGISDLLKNLGQTGSGSATSLSALVGLISSGKGKADSAVSSDFDLVLRNASERGEELMQWVEGVSENISNVSEWRKMRGESVSGSIRDSLDSGGVEVKNSLAASGSSAARAQAKIRSQIRQKAEGNIRKAEKERNSADALIMASQGTRAGAYNIRNMISGFSRGDEEAVSVLFSALGNSNDGVAATIAEQSDQVRSEFNESQATGGWAEKRNLVALVESYLDQLGGKKSTLEYITNAASFASNASMNTIQKLQAQTAALESDAPVGGEQSGGSEEFDQKLNELVTVDSNERIAKLSAQYGPSLTRTVLAPFLQSLSAYIMSEKNNISNTVEQIRGAVSGMSDQSGKASIQLSTLNSKLQSLLADSDGWFNAFSSEVREAGSEFDKLAEFHKGNLSELNSTLLDMEAEAEAGIKNISAALSLQIQALPSNISAEISKAENEFAAASSDLEFKIQQARERLASSQSGEETQEAIAGLVVLTKLQKLQETVSDTDRSLRSKLQGESSASLESSVQVKDSLTGLLSGINRISRDLETRNSKIDQSLETVAESGSELQSGYSVLLNSTVESLGWSAAQAAGRSTAGFLSGLQGIENAARAVVRGTNVLGSTTTGRINSSLSEMEKIDFLMTQTHAVTKSSKRSIFQTVGDLMNEVNLLSSKLSNTAKGDVSDAVSRLQAVRHTMASLMGLWNEFAFSLGQKSAAFHKTDSEFLSRMMGEIRHQLVRGEAFGKASSEEISKQGRFIDLVSSGQSETENRMQELFSDLKHKLNEVNRNGFEVRHRIVNQLDELSDASHTETSEVLKMIKTELDEQLSTFTSFNTGG